MRRAERGEAGGGPKRRRRSSHDKYAPERYIPELPERAAGIAGALEVSAVAPHPSEPDAVIIRVGRRRVATVDSRDLAHTPVEPGEVWSDDLARRVGSLAALRAARRDAVSLTAARAMSERAVADRLIRRGLGRADAARIVAELRDAGLVDDDSLARDVADVMIRRKPSGKRGIEAALRRKGIGRDASAAAAASALDGKDEHELALGVARQRAARMSGRLDGQTAARRLYGLLARRGFSGDACRDAVRVALREVGLDADGRSAG